MEGYIFHWLCTTVPAKSDALPLWKEVSTLAPK